MPTVTEDKRDFKILPGYQTLGYVLNEINPDFSIINTCNKKIEIKRTHFLVSFGFLSGFLRRNRAFKCGKSTFTRIC